MRSAAVRVLRRPAAGVDTPDLVSCPVDLAGVDVDLAVPGLPVEFHCHGIGNIDFSDLDRLSLEAVEAAARAEGVRCLPTVSLPYRQLDRFVSVMGEFAERRAAGAHTHVVGLALEGPLLGSFGGTPADGVWAPTRAEWERLAACGPLGLRAMVLSPDALLPASPLAALRGPQHPDLAWVVRLLVDHGVRPALGHFLRSDPARTAECIREALDLAAGAGVRPFSGGVVTDHLFNDMPLHFVHAWRTEERRPARRAELAGARLDEWSLGSVVELCGDVPGTLIREAHAGRLTLCLNFDGDHVDIEVARRAAELVGSRSVIVMTDRTDRPCFGGQPLSRRPDNSLYYQSDGIVAAGSTGIDRQILTMRGAGIPERDVWAMACFTPSAVLGLPAPDDPGSWSWVDRDGARHFRHPMGWGRGPVSAVVSRV
jgi:N-acetylglucosamine-6-phosphate deacetylase